MWPFESAKAISAAITVLHEYANEVTTLNKDKLWRMLWQYTAIHTPLWKITNCTDGTYLDVAKNCAAGGTGSIPTCCYGGHSLSLSLRFSLPPSLAPSLPPSLISLCVSVAAKVATWRCRRASNTHNQAGLHALCERHILLSPAHSLIQLIRSRAAGSSRLHRLRYVRTDPAGRAQVLDCGKWLRGRR